MAREAGIPGWIPVWENFRINVGTGTTAEEYVTDITSGYRRVLKAARFIATGDGAGAGGTRTLRVIKNTATVAASGAVALASTTTKGTVTNLTVATSRDDRTFGDSDTITLDVPATGTAFTTLTGNVELEWLIRPQATVA